MGFFHFPLIPSPFSPFLKSMLSITLAAPPPPSKTGGYIQPFTAPLVIPLM